MAGLSEWKSFKEEAMPARSTRQEARARILKAFAAQLEQVIPADETVPLKGATFADFEDQVETLARAALPVALEERAALMENAQVERPGRCPHCGSDGVYLEKEETQPPVQSRHGPVVVPKQHARCRACGGSFSPSGAGLGLAGRSTADAAGGAARGAGGGAAVV
jgi:predicted Zn-ribbon and HTH transcriptional regulator